MSKNIIKMMNIWMKMKMHNKLTNSDKFYNKLIKHY